MIFSTLIKAIAYEHESVSPLCYFFIWSWSWFWTRGRYGESDSRFTSPPSPHWTDGPFSYQFSPFRFVLIQMKAKATYLSNVPQDSWGFLMFVLGDL